jgi:hypothetical protein
MPRFLDTRGNSTLAIGVCDRCKMKRALSCFSSDTNFPGLRVCDQGCKDQLDPYRLPARQTERIALRFPRPDVSVAVDPNALTIGGYSQAVISLEQNLGIVENDGNLDGLQVTPTPVIPTPVEPANG